MQSSLKIFFVASNVQPESFDTLDHHEESNDHIDISKNIQLVGSCCTLIAEDIYYNKRDLLCPLISLLLVVPVLADTLNLNLHSGRTTEKDVFFGNVLLTNIELDQDELYNEILIGKSSDLVNVLTIQV